MTGFQLTGALQGPLLKASTWHSYSGKVGEKIRYNSSGPELGQRKDALISSGAVRRLRPRTLPAADEFMTRANSTGVSATHLHKEGWTLSHLGKETFPKKTPLLVIYCRLTYQGWNTEHRGGRWGISYRVLGG